MTAKQEEIIIALKKMDDGDIDNDICDRCNVQNRPVGKPEPKSFECKHCDGTGEVKAEPFPEDIDEVVKSEPKDTIQISRNDAKRYAIGRMTPDEMQVIVRKALKEGK